MNKEELVNDNEYKIKLTQYYEQVDNPLLHDRKGLLNSLFNDIEGASDTISLEGYRALLELYLATNNKC